MYGWILFNPEWAELISFLHTYFFQNAPSIKDYIGG